MSYKFLLSLTLCGILMMSCKPVSPEQRAAEAALSYYHDLTNDRVEDFLEGKAGVDKLPADYCDQLLETYRKYLADIEEKHGGIHEIQISPNVGRCDSTLHLTYAFLLLCYNDSTQEEVVVPMVEENGNWKMK